MRRSRPHRPRSPQSGERRTGRSDARARQGRHRGRRRRPRGSEWPAVPRPRGTRRCEPRRGRDQVPERRGGTCPGRVRRRPHRSRYWKGATTLGRGWRSGTNAKPVRPGRPMHPGHRGERRRGLPPVWRLPSAYGSTAYAAAKPNMLAPRGRNCSGTPAAMALTSHHTVRASRLPTSISPRGSGRSRTSATTTTTREVSATAKASADQNPPSRHPSITNNP